MKIKAANTILYCKKWDETVSFYRDGLKLLVISSNEMYLLDYYLFRIDTNQMEIVGCH